MDSDINEQDEFSPSRRQVLAGVGGVGLLAAASHMPGRQHGHARPAGSAGDKEGTPEQIHLTWGNDPATTMVVSWASQGPVAARVLVSEDTGSRHLHSDRAAMVKAVQRTYTA